MTKLSAFTIVFIGLLVYSCRTDQPVGCDSLSFDYNHQKGCDGQAYPDPVTSPYVLPYPNGTTYKTGLTNCSSSYHAAEYPDRYAFDFDMPVGSSFYACRGGVVVKVVNDQPSIAGNGNYCVIDHGDNTYGLYLHSPENGISVHIGQNVRQGDLLGVTGKSGLAGYPHLHFIVVQNAYAWPYDAIPITFKNVNPPDVVLKSYTNYAACSY